MSLKREIPVLLSKHEALAFAADQLSRMAEGLELSAMIQDLTKGEDLGSEVRGKLSQLRRDMPEPKLQASVAREAAAAIRDLALEERLLEARMRQTSAEAGGR